MDKQEIRLGFSVNGQRRTLTLEGWERLSDVLRDNLDLTGTKRGCDDASCGACTVILDGEAVKSCVTNVKKVQDKEVLSIEGMCKGTTLHPIQTALIEAGAVQCGFCIPGIVMRLHVLFSKNLEASREQIIDALETHLCRCTGYESILDGALLAQQKLRG